MIWWSLPRLLFSWHVRHLWSGATRIWPSYANPVHETEVLRGHDSGLCSPGSQILPTGLGKSKTILVFSIIDHILGAGQSCHLQPHNSKVFSTYLTYLHQIIGTMYLLKEWLIKTNVVPWTIQLSVLLLILFASWTKNRPLARHTITWMLN